MRMIALSFIWATLLVLASFATTAMLSSSYVPLVAVAWAVAFIAAKTTIVPYDPRHTNPHLLKFS
jgi:hypothetical protein